MAANKKKQDEKHLKMLREMVTFPSNKQCFDCNQRGPTYVNMTVGSFVCTSCSGILRGLHPPHRIKSISMASFTPEEMDFLKSHGNELNKKVYLGLYDGQTSPGPESKDEQHVRDYMIQKYERKRWYVAPTDAMQEEAKWANEAALNSKPQVKPLRSLLGENSAKHSAGSGQTVPASHVPVQVSVPLPGGFTSPPATITQTNIPVATAAGKASSGFDFLADLGGDPFASSAPAGNSNGNVDGFADFSNFGSMSSSPSHQPTVAPAHPPVGFAAQAFPVSATPLQPTAKGQASTPTTSNKPPAQTFSQGGDKYAALTGLDTALTTPVTTITSVNWGGTDSGIINWGGTSSTAGTPSQASSGAINWNNQGLVGATVGNTSSTSGFGVSSSAVNPFGGVQTTGLAQFSGSSPVSTFNPFGATGGGAQFSQGNMPVGAGYAGQFAAPGQAGGFGQFQNGGFGMASPAAGYGVAGSFTQQQYMMPSQTAGVVQQAGGWGQFGSVPASQPASNPFMNTPMHQQAPPHSGSTNPFL